MKDNEGREAVGAMIRSRRLELGMTQRDLANKLGFNYTVIISQIENGTVSTPVERWAALADSLQVSQNDFAVRCLHHLYPDVYRMLFSGLTPDRAVEFLGMLPQPA